MHMNTVYQYIKEQILRVRFSPGERLVASVFAAELGVSRTPVREALGRLAQEGLLSRSSGWGFVVRELHLDDVVDLYRVREALEVEAAREAASRLDKSLLIVLAQFLEQARAAFERGEMHLFLEHCRRFHHSIAVGTRNEALQETLSMINDRIQLVSARVLQVSPERASEIYQENRSLLEALDARDADAAVRAVKQHIRKATDYAALKLHENEYPSRMAGNE